MFFRREETAAVRLVKKLCAGEKRVRRRKRWSDVLVSDMKRAGVSVEGAGVRVKWKLRTRVAEPE